MGRLAQFTLITKYLFNCPVWLVHLKASLLNYPDLFVLCVRVCVGEAGARGGRGLINDCSQKYGLERVMSNRGM